jgi:hypothetical protein
VNDTVSEVILKNANDGTACYDLMAGLFRIRCLNSLVTQTATLESVKVRHSGPEVAHKVIEGTYKVLDAAHAALEAPANWSMKQLAPPAVNAFCEAAHVLRFGDAEGHVDTPIRPAQLNFVRRIGDYDNDLWTTFNRVQENCLKGGLSARQERKQGERRGRMVTTRQVNGIDQDVRLNQALWVLATRMAELTA